MTVEEVIKKLQTYPKEAIFIGNTHYSDEVFTKLDILQLGYYNDVDGVYFTDEDIINEALDTTEMERAVLFQ